MVHAGYNFVGKNIGEGYNNGFDGIVNSFFSSAANRASHKKVLDVTFLFRGGTYDRRATDARLSTSYSRASEY